MALTKEHPVFQKQPTMLLKKNRKTAQFSAMMKMIGTLLDLLFSFRVMSIFITNGYEYIGSLHQTQQQQQQQQPPHSVSHQQNEMKSKKLSRQNRREMKKRIS